MLAHGHSLGSIAQIDEVRMRGIVQMWVDGQINGRAQTDVLVYLLQAQHSMAGSKKIPTYRDISPNTFDYLSPPPTEEEQALLDYKEMMLHMLQNTDNMPEELRNTIT